MKILVVDDDAMVLESCKRILEAEGLSVQIVQDTEKALVAMGKEPSFDLILTDIKMPGEDGFQLIGRVRENFSKTAILVMTGYLIPETIDKGIQRGADGFIAKPFTPEELINSVHKAVSDLNTKDAL